ncbi:hypothetical protein FACS1894116_07800 [Betaproteobacteria bacterium]|nr:hypothetical protein FACS1894116_07800 [Betaproteobacteria bacterium]GHT97826.1 hypothetical protein FACS1894154_02060 [Betaproteobacteria bacterium]GHU30155.1 hypothetical protein FACS189497_09460 [Betaproteobacteria bacterium]
MDFFEEALLRLKQQVGVKTDKEVAALLGLSASALNTRKKRGNFPETELYALAAKRPDLRLDVGLVLHGDRLTHDQRVALAVTAAYPPAGIPDAAAQGVRMFLELNDKRRAQYQRIGEILDDCSDDAVELVMQLVDKLHQVEIKARR